MALGRGRGARGLPRPVELLSRAHAVARLRLSRERLAAIHRSPKRVSSVVALLRVQPRALDDARGFPVGGRSVGFAGGRRVGSAGLRLGLPLLRLPHRASRVLPGALFGGDVEVVLLPALRVPVPLPRHAVELERVAIRALRHARPVPFGRRPRLAAHVARRSLRRVVALDDPHLSLRGLHERRREDQIQQRQGDRGVPIRRTRGVASAHRARRRVAARVTTVRAAAENSVVEIRHRFSSWGPTNANNLNPFPEKNLPGLAAKPGKHRGAFTTQTQRN